jgi:hypothetical protein
MATPTNHFVNRISYIVARYIKTITSYAPNYKLLNTKYNYGGIPPP